MSSTATFCIVSTDPQAAAIVNQLKACGFSTNDISVLTPKTRQQEEIKEPKGSMVENILTGMSTGTLLGSLVGWLTGMGELTSLKALSLLVSAGPMAAILIGAALGMAFGGMLGALVGFGFHEYFLKRHTDWLKKSSILVAVNTHTTEQINRARTVFKEAYRSVPRLRERAI